MSDGSGQTAWSYDAMGRIVAERETIAGVTKTTSYAYDLDGSLASITYPGGRVVNYAYSNAQRPVSAIDSGGTQYVTSATYAPQGGLAGDVHGQVSGGFAGIAESWQYNTDFEPTSVSDSSSAGTALSLSYSYSLPGGNNGSVAAMNNGNDSGRNESFTYDPLDRILKAQTAATSGQDCWGLQFGTTWNLGDDALGNLVAMTPTKCTGPSLSVSVNANNQITNTGFSYDAAGNTTGDGTYSYAYNAENQVTSAAGVNYAYDGNGLRVEKSSGTLYWRSYSGQVLEESDTSGNMQTDYIFFDGRRIAWADSGGNVRYQFADALGSTRVVTTSSGTTCFNTDYYPYGQENDYTTTCSPTYRFTGYEFDSETGNFYAYARYYDPRLGRFLSADPLNGGVPASTGAAAAPASTLAGGIFAFSARPLAVGLPTAPPGSTGCTGCGCAQTSSGLSDPQGLNRYAYVLNNPTSRVDRSGLQFDECEYLWADCVQAAKAVEQSIEDRLGVPGCSQFCEAALGDDPLAFIFCPTMCVMVALVPRIWAGLAYVYYLIAYCKLAKEKCEKLPTYF